jgi:hypothetical protein
MIYWCNRMLVRWINNVSGKPALSTFLVETWSLIVTLWHLSTKQHGVISQKTIILIRTVARMSRDSSVGTATGYGLDDRGVGVGVPVGSRIFSSPHRPDRLWGPPTLLSNGYLGFFPGGKVAGAEVKKMWIYTSIPPYAFVA